LAELTFAIVKANAKACSQLHGRFKKAQAGKTFKSQKYQRNTANTLHTIGHFKKHPSTSYQDQIACSSIK